MGALGITDVVDEVATIDGGGVHEISLANPQASRRGTVNHECERPLPKGTSRDAFDVHRYTPIWQCRVEWEDLRHRSDEGQFRGG